MTEDAQLIEELQQKAAEVAEEKKAKPEPWLPITNRIYDEMELDLNRFGIQGPASELLLATVAWGVGKEAHQLWRAQLRTNLILLFLGFGLIVDVGFRIWEVLR